MFEEVTGMVTLENVIDVRTGKFHSIVKVKARLAKYFVPAESGGVSYDKD